MPGLALRFNSLEITNKVLRSVFSGTPFGNFL